MTDESTTNSQWLIRLVDGDSEAVGEFLTAFGPALQKIAADRMSPALQQRVGPDDVFQSVCRTFFSPCSQWAVCLAGPRKSLATAVRDHAQQGADAGQISYGSEASNRK